MFTFLPFITLSNAPITCLPFTVLSPFSRCNPPLSLYPSFHPHTPTLSSFAAPKTDTLLFSLNSRASRVITCTCDGWSAAPPLNTFHYRERTYRTGEEPRTSSPYIPVSVHLYPIPCLTCGGYELQMGFLWCVTVGSLNLFIFFSLIILVLLYFSSSKLKRRKVGV